ncbi:hypothetical protein [Sneathiella glossodoripedis]|uniref:hypothetical protein n=1 Tax=Sneathiella glossodoripedis TaxID=418853 RepID=UPI00046F44DB|nr:hypothetical protein [Sneathiella glossodoripedis]
MFTSEKIKTATITAVIGLGGIALAHTIGVQGFLSHMNQMFQEGIYMLTSAFEDAVIGYMFEGRGIETASFE